MGFVQVQLSNSASKFTVEADYYLFPGYFEF